MYKLAKYLVALGERRAGDKLRADLFYFLGWQPERLINEEMDAQESEGHYQKRLDAWFMARELVNDFFKAVDERNKK